MLTGRSPRTALHGGIDRVVPFDAAQSAAERMRANEAAGKIVLELP
jgi:NADPH:quinone reductase-like Zn-dependent oxidoreductase